MGFVGATPHHATSCMCGPLIKDEPHALRVKPGEAPPGDAPSPRPLHHVREPQDLQNPAKPTRVPRRHHPHHRLAPRFCELGARESEAQHGAHKLTWGRDTRHPARHTHDVNLVSASKTLVHSGGVRRLGKGVPEPCKLVAGPKKSGRDDRSGSIAIRVTRCYGKRARMRGSRLGS